MQNHCGQKLVSKGKMGFFMNLEKRFVDFFFFSSLEIVKLFFFYHMLLTFETGKGGKEYPTQNTELLTQL